MNIGVLTFFIEQQKGNFLFFNRNNKATITLNLHCDNPKITMRKKLDF